MVIEEVHEALPLLSLNHVSLLVRSVWTSVQFYEDVLGFGLIKRPSSFNFHGAWSFLSPSLFLSPTSTHLLPEYHVSKQCLFFIRSEHAFQNIICCVVWRYKAKQKYLPIHVNIFFRRKKINE